MGHHQADSHIPEIALIDDDLNSLKATKRILIGKGYRVVPFQDPKAFLEYDLAGIDLILCDVSMPHMNGFDVFDQIRRNELTRHIPFVFISGTKIEYEFVFDAFNLGVADFISKTCSKGELLGRVKRALHQGRLITERMQAEQAYRISENSYRSLFENIHDGFAYCEILLDGDGRPKDFIYLEVNDSFEKSTGLKREEVIGKKVSELFPSIHSVHPEIIDIYGEVALTGKGTRFEIFFSPLEIWLSIVVFSPQKGYFVAVFDDITARKNADQALRESEERYRMLFQNAGEAIVVAQDERVKLANPAAADLIGLSSNDVKDQSLWHFIHENDRELVLERHRERIKGDSPPDRYTFRLIRSEGDIRWVEIDVVPFSWEKRPATLSFLRDVTQRKKIESALKQSEQKYRSIIGSIEDVYYEVDLAGNFTLANDRIVEMFGYSRNELLGTNYRNYVDEQSAKQVFKAFNNVHRTGKPLKAIEHEITAKSGSRRFIETSATLIKDSLGGATGFRGIIRDITARKHMELALRDSEQFNSALLNHSPTTIVVINPDTSIRYANPSMLKKTGFSFEEIVGRKPPYPWWPEETLHETIKSFQNLMISEKTITLEKLFKTKDGKRFWVQITAAPIKSNGKLNYILTNWVDITDRKLAEQAVRQSEQKYRTIVNSLEDTYFETDLSGNLNFVNDRMIQISGYSRNELLETNCRERMDEENARKLFESFNHASRTGIPAKAVEYEVIIKDGTRRVVEGFVTLLKDSQGKSAGFRCLSRDITERKKTEEELRMFRRFAEASGQGFGWADVNGNIRYMNQTLCKMAGDERPEDVYGKQVETYYVQEDRVRLQEVVFPALLDSGKWEGELTIRTKQGNLIPTHNGLFLIRGKDGSPQCYANVVTDISERKRAEDALRKSHDELEKTISELKRTQSQMIQSEKMASIGQLAAGVAHEINNPTGFVNSNLQTLKDYQDDMVKLMEEYRNLIAEVKSGVKQETSSPSMKERLERIDEFEKEMDVDYVLNDVQDLIKESLEGVDRIKNIVKDLKDFAHPGDEKVKFADINANVDSTLNVVWNEIKYKAKVFKDYGELPQVRCYPQQLNQVFANVLVNAAQAIEKEGEIKIVTRADDGHVEIRISDTGPGIPEENLGRIFDPFFTTKEVGKGTGLGLNVAYNIVKKHHGTIEVDSTVGSGATFIIRLPVDEGTKPAAFPDGQQQTSK